ncbi:MAG: AAA family ATPase [Candidatus Baltobacteraceae bacterium]
MIITISNLYGCGAIAVAHAAAGQLGYEYVDEQLPVIVAKRLQTSPQAVESAEDAVDSVGDRMLRALESGTPEIAAAPGATFDEEYLREVREAVRDYAARGDAVLIGRGGGAILGRGPGILRVFMHAPRDWRIGHIVEALGVSQNAAIAEIDRIDRARAKHIETNYGLKWTDARNYDLCIDVAALGTEGATQAIVAAARAR